MGAVRQCLRAFMALVMLAACASSMPQGSVSLKAVTGETSKTAPEGVRVSTYPSALGLTCEKRASTDGAVIACKDDDQWLLFR
ncbi:MAG: hypothetical protein AAGG79_00825, partial [Pseudomonadota bacterium]